MKLSERIQGWTAPAAEYDDDFAKIIDEWVDEVAQLEDVYSNLMKSHEQALSDYHVLKAEIERLDGQVVEAGALLIEIRDKIDALINREMKE